MTSINSLIIYKGYWTTGLQNVTYLGTVISFKPWSLMCIIKVKDAHHHVTSVDLVMMSIKAITISQASNYKRFE